MRRDSRRDSRQSGAFMTGRGAEDAGRGVALNTDGIEAPVTGCVDGGREVRNAEAVDTMMI